MNPRLVRFYRITFLVILGLFVVLINLGHFYGCAEGSCLTPFIISFDLFWLAFFYIVLDMYRGNWGSQSSEIKTRGFYWFGWIMIFLGPIVVYLYSWLPLFLKHYDYREYMHGRGQHGGAALMGKFLQFLGENYGMWLPSLISLAIATLILWTGVLIIRKKHPFNKEHKHPKNQLRNSSGWK